MGHASHGAHGAEWAPLLALAIAAAAYVAAAQRRRGAGRRWSPWRTASWIAGVGLLALALAPPVASRAHVDLRAHMLQHLLVGMLAPLGLVLAAPMTLALRTLPVTTARQVVRLLGSRPLRWLGHPVAGLLLSVGGMYLLYLTPLYALSLRSGLAHQAIHAHFLLAGCLFAWAIAGVDPAPHRAGWRTRLAVLFAAMAAHATLAKLMYAHGWPRGTPHDLAQIQDAAQLMYYGGDFAELLLAAVLFGQWYRGRRRPDPTQTHARATVAPPGTSSAGG